MRAMIISVGGTPEPLVHSLNEHKPDFVCFLASQQSLDLIGDIKRQLREKGHSVEDYKVICEDINDLVHCYEKALECTERIAGVCDDPNMVVVDYTGGTKTMTAALALATVGHGYRFSYVGGQERTKSGLGVVITGTEAVETGVSPWQIFAVEEKKLAESFVNSYQFEAAIRIIEDIIQKLPDNEAVLWGYVLKIVQGLRAWDLFEHRKASGPLYEGTLGLKEALKLSPNERLSRFLKGAEECRQRSDYIKEKTNKFQELDISLATDILANAGRRAEEGKYDDAVARIYRALEMVGQVAYLEEFGHSNSNADLMQLPETLREDYRERYQSPLDNKIKIPLEATFKALKENGNPKGNVFFQRKNEFNGLLLARNGSILAHGQKAVGKEIFDQFFSLLRETFLKGELVSFPKL